MCVFSYIDEESFAVEEVGELVQRLGDRSPAGFWDIQFAGDHDVVGAILRGQEEDAVGVGLVVQERDPALADVVAVVLHFDHQICTGNDTPNVNDVLASNSTLQIQVNLSRQF